MQSSEKQKFAELVTNVMAFYKQDVSEFAVSVWWQACERFDYTQVARALTAHAMDAEKGVFPPKPADVVRALEGTKSDRALIAWGKVHEAMSAVGAYTDVVFDDPAIHAAIEDMGGWPKICRTESDQLSYLQHVFCETHKAYTERGKFEYPRMLGGDRSSDDVYKIRGMSPPKPAIIGDIDIARMVYVGGNRGGKTQITMSNPVAKLAIQGK